MIDPPTQFTDTVYDLCHHMDNQQTACLDRDLYNEFQIERPAQKRKELYEQLFCSEDDVLPFPEPPKQKQEPVKRVKHRRVQSCFVEKSISPPSNKKTTDHFLNEEPKNKQLTAAGAVIWNPKNETLEIDVAALKLMNHFVLLEKKGDSFNFVLRTAKV